MSSPHPDGTRRYRYKARGSNGTVVTRVVQATSPEEVTRDLVAAGMVPLAAPRPVGGSWLPAGGLRLRKHARPRDLSIAIRTLATMLSSGSYLEALDAVHDGCTDPVLAEALATARREVANGRTLAPAMATRPLVFPQMLVNLVAAGEAAGRVPQAMDEAADVLEAADGMRAKVKKAMLYPVVVGVIAVAVLVGMLVFLVPMFTDSLNSFGGPDAQLPALTRAVMAASEASLVVVPLLAAALVPVVLWYRRNRHTDRVREVVDPLKLRLPVFGRLFHLIALERFTRDLSTLLGAGVKRLEALEIAAGSCGNIRMERAVLAAREAQRQGRPLVEPLRAEPLFPAALIQLVEAGERRGSTPARLADAARLYKRDVDYMTDNLATLLSPVLTVLLAGTIGVVVLALYAPSLSLFEELLPT